MVLSLKNKNEETQMIYPEKSESPGYVPGSIFDRLSAEHLHYIKVNTNVQ